MELYLIRKNIISGRGARQSADAGYELDASEVLKLRSLGAPYNVAQFQEWFGRRGSITCDRQRE